MLSRSSLFFFSPENTPPGESEDKIPEGMAAWQWDETRKKPKSIDAQLAGALAHIKDLEGQIAKVGLSPTALARISALEGDLAQAAKDRDEAVKIANNPSIQAQYILAQAGAPAMPTRTNASAHPGETKPDQANIGAKKGIRAAIARAEAAHRQSQQNR